MMRYPKLIILVGVCALVGCDWFDDLLEANLPPDTELTECASGQGVVEGDDVRFVWRGDDVDGDVTGCEWSYDGADWQPSDSDTIEVRGVAQGEHVFRVRAVDDKGERDPSPAECSFVASVAGKLVERVVLLELFTTVRCANCPKSETALNAMLDDLGRAEISVIAYHDQPEMDGLATPETEARIAWYTGNPAFPGKEDTYPTVVFDGGRIFVGALTADQAEANYRLEVTTRAETGSPISLGVSGDIGSSQGSVTVTAKAEDDPPDGSLVLRYVVIEDDVPYRGVASEYDFVARLLLEDEPLGLTAVGDSVTVERQFEVDASWVVGNMDVIVFIQDIQTMEVVQSGRLKLN
jgi:hypothetical protein